MKKLVLPLMALLLSHVCGAQKLSDLFSPSSTNIVWLGIDYSHVKLIGNFSQIAEGGEVGPAEIKSKYFRAWNNLILDEYKKYNIGEMVRKENVILEIDGVMKINESAPIEDMEANSTPVYSLTQIQDFVRNYDFGVKDGIGLMFLCESLNKRNEEGVYHFVVLNLTNNEILLTERFIGKTGGFGLRNYWATTYLRVIEQIREEKYKGWKKAHGGK